MFATQYFTFTRHQQPLSDHLQIMEAENLLFRLAFWL